MSIQPASHSVVLGIENVYSQVACANSNAESCYSSSLRSRGAATVIERRASRPHPCSDAMLDHFGTPLTIREGDIWCVSAPAFHCELRAEEEILSVVEDAVCLPKDYRAA